MKIQNKKTKIIIYPAIIYRKTRKCVKFGGVIMAIDGRLFRKYWKIIIN